jgi:hypothetical protein
MRPRDRAEIARLLCVMSEKRWFTAGEIARKADSLTAATVTRHLLSIGSALVEHRGKTMTNRNGKSWQRYEYRRLPGALAEFERVNGLIGSAK